MRSTRRVTVALSLVVLLATACGPQVPAEQRLAGAAASTTAQATARFSVEARTEVGDGARMDFTVVGDGEADFTTGRWRLEMEMPGMLGMGRGMEMIGDGDVMYLRMRMPGLDDDRWMRHDPEDAGAAAAGGPGPMGAGPGTDPTQILEVLAAAAGEIEQLERTEIDGVDVDGYAFTVAARDLLGIDGEAPGAQHLDESDADVEAWLDRDDRVRRIRFTLDMGQPAVSMGAETHAQGEAADPLDSWDDDSEGEVPRSPDEPRDVPAPAPLSVETTQTVTIDWFDFGEPVDIVPPDEDQVVDEATYLERMEGSLSDSASARGEVVEDDIVEFYEEDVHIEADSFEAEAVEPDVHDTEADDTEAGDVEAGDAEAGDAEAGGRLEADPPEPEAEPTP